MTAVNGICYLEECSGNDDRSLERECAVLLPLFPQRLPPPTHLAPICHTRAVCLGGVGQLGLRFGLRLALRREIVLAGDLGVLF